MTFVVGLALASLGFIFGIITFCNTVDSWKEKLIKNSGHIVVGDRLYKCVEVKEG